MADRWYKTLGRNVLRVWAPLTINGRPYTLPEAAAAARRLWGNFIAGYRGEDGGEPQDRAEGQQTLQRKQQPPQNQ